MSIFIYKSKAQKQVLWIVSHNIEFRGAGESRFRFVSVFRFWELLLFSFFFVSKAGKLLWLQRRKSTLRESLKVTHKREKKEKKNERDDAAGGGHNDGTTVNGRTIAGMMSTTTEGIRTQGAPQMEGQQSVYIAR